MTTTRAYTWHIFPTRNVTWTAGRFETLIQAARARDDRILFSNVITIEVQYDTAGILAKDMAPIIVQLKVIGRDIHAAGQIAQDLIAAGCISTKSRAMPQPETIPAHTNRGYAAGRTKTSRTRGDRGRETARGSADGANLQ